jgi:hypothetical protein
VRSDVLIESIFSGDPVDSLGRVQESCAALESFKNSYMGFKVLTVDGRSAFTLKSQAVMPRFMRTTKQMDEVKPLLHTIVDLS